MISQRELYGIEKAVRQQEKGAHTVSALAAGFILSGKQIKLCRYD